MDWAPRATLEDLHRRARLLADIRGYMAREQVLEVDPPLLSQRACLDPQVPSIAVPMRNSPTRYLQSSPENHMKRLLAAGSGSIYALGRAFRADERGRWHSPEFCLLEWYRIGFDDQALMRDVAALIEDLGGPSDWRQARYSDLLREYTDLDALDVDTAALVEYCQGEGLMDAENADRDSLLDFMFATRVGPQLGHAGLQFVTHYPASQAALARLDGDDPRFAHRFELYWRGLELANGFFELTDPEEQARRFAAEAAQREQQGLAALPTDESLLGALQHGLPDCSGVALGVDRLLALLLGAKRIDDVQAFAWEQA